MLGKQVANKMDIKCAFSKKKFIITFMQNKENWKNMKKKKINTGLEKNTIQNTTCQEVILYGPSLAENRTFFPVHVTIYHIL